MLLKYLFFLSCLRFTFSKGGQAVNQLQGVFPVCSLSFIARLVHAVVRVIDDRRQGWFERNFKAKYVTVEEVVFTCCVVNFTILWHKRYCRKNCNWLHISETESQVVFLC